MTEPNDLVLLFSDPVVLHSSKNKTEPAGSVRFGGFFRFLHTPIPNNLGALLPISVN